MEQHGSDNRKVSGRRKVVRSWVVIFPEASRAPMTVLASCGQLKVVGKSRWSRVAPSTSTNAICPARGPEVHTAYPNEPQGSASVTPGSTTGCSSVCQSLLALLANSARWTASLNWVGGLLLEYVAFWKSGEFTVGGT